MEQELIKGNGLIPLPPNPGKREDLSHAVVYGVLGASQLPTTSFRVSTPLVIKDQRNLDFCTGFASTEITEDQEKIEMDPLFQFAAIKKQQGEFKSYGADLRSAGMALVRSGSLPQANAPYKIGEQARDFLANWANYPQALWDLAKTYQKLTMFFVDGPYSLFENIIMTLFQNKEEHRSVLLGVTWRKSWVNAPGGVIPEWTPLKAADVDGGHCIKGFGLEIINGKRYLVIQNSWGSGYGDGGIFYFPASVVNNDFGPWGQITFKDMDPNDAHDIQAKKKEEEKQQTIDLIQQAINLIVQILAKMKETAKAALGIK